MRRNGRSISRHRVRIERIEVGGRHSRPIEHFHQVVHRRSMGHEPLSILTHRNDGQLEIDPAGILRDELMDLRHVDIADREEGDILIRIFQKIFQPLHGLRVQEQVGPFHVLVAADAPELHRIAGLLIDVIEYVGPVLIGRLGRIERLTVGMVDLIAERTLHRTALAQAQRDFSPIHLPAERVAIIFRLEDWNRLEQRQRDTHDTRYENGNSRHDDGPSI